MKDISDICLGYILPESSASFALASDSNCATKVVEPQLNIRQGGVSSSLGLRVFSPCWEGMQLGLAYGSTNFEYVNSMAKYATKDGAEMSMLFSLSNNLISNVGIRTFFELGSQRVHERRTLAKGSESKDSNIPFVGVVFGWQGGDGQGLSGFVGSGYRTYLREKAVFVENSPLPRQEVSLHYGFGWSF